MWNSCAKRKTVQNKNSVLNSCFLFLSTKLRVELRVRCQPVPNPSQNLLQTLNLMCLFLTLYTFLVSYIFKRQTYWWRCQPKITIPEDKYMGKNSSTMDFAHSRADSVADCCYWGGKGIISFPWAVDGRRRGSNYSNRVSTEKHGNKSSPALKDLEKRWMSKDGGIWVVDVGFLSLLPDLLFGTFVGITIEPFAFS